MNSRLYHAQVWHARLAPVRHQFRYRMFLLLLDLDELPMLDAQLRFFSINRANWYAWHERDHLPLHAPRAPGDPAIGDAPTLAERVRHVVADAGGPADAIARIELLTLPRILGYVFNPVCFYFCRDRDGHVVARVAEVTNTFGETKPYVLLGETTARPKDFYVSPFSRVDDAFAFHLPVPDAHLRLQVDTWRADGRTLTSRLVGRAVPLTDQALFRLGFTCPLLTLRVIGGIHGQALRLFLKRVPWYSKSHDVAHQRGVYRAHPSLLLPSRHASFRPHVH